MSEGRWSGGTANRQWARPGSRHWAGPDPAGTARWARLTAHLAGEYFFCETCRGTHPLAGMQACRDARQTRRPA